MVLAIMGGFHLYNLLYILLDGATEAWKRLAGFSLLLISLALIAKQARDEYRQSQIKKKPRSNQTSIMATEGAEDPNAVRTSIET